MADKKKQNTGGAVELAEKDLDEVQGGATAIKSSDTTSSSNTVPKIPGRLKWTDVSLKR